MSIPKYKENAVDRHERLDLGKPHIYWHKSLGQWLARKGSSLDNCFCISQDARWTPRSKQ